MRTVWRMAYNLPPNDPQVLEATDLEVLEDLMTLGYYGHEKQRLFDPKGAAAAELAHEDIPAAFEELVHDATHGELQRRIQAFEQSREPTERRVTGLQIRGGSFVGGKGRE